MTATGATLPSDGIHDLDWIKSALQTADGARVLDAALVPVVDVLARGAELHGLQRRSAAWRWRRWSTWPSPATCSLHWAVDRSVGRTSRRASRRTGLPGGVEPDLRVGLAPLSRLTARAASCGSRCRPDAPARGRDDETYPTIAPSTVRSATRSRANADAVRSAVTAGGRRATRWATTSGSRPSRRRPVPTSIDQLLAGVRRDRPSGEGSLGNVDSSPATSPRTSCLTTGSSPSSTYEAPVPGPGASTARRPSPLLPSSSGSAPSPGRSSSIRSAVPSDGYERILDVDPGASKSGPTSRSSIPDSRVSCRSWIRSGTGRPTQSWPTLGAAVKAMVDLRVLSCFHDHALRGARRGRRAAP